MTTHRIVVSLATLAVTFAAATPLVAQSHIVVPPDKLQWGPAPPALPAGAEISVLEGNPGEKGTATLRASSSPPTTPFRRTGTA